MDMYVNFIAGLSVFFDKYPAILYILLLLSAILGILAALSFCDTYSRNDDVSDMQD